MCEIPIYIDYNMILAPPSGQFMINQICFANISTTGGMVRWLKKSSKDVKSHDWLCIWNRDGSKFEPFIFPLFSLRNIDHVSFCRSGSLFLARKNWDGSKFESFWFEFNFSPNFEPSRFFRAKKSEPLRQKDTWSIFRRENKRKMNGSNFKPSRFQMQSLSCDLTSFDDFLSHLTIPPVPAFQKLWFQPRLKIQPLGNSSLKNVDHGEIVRNICWYVYVLIAFPILNSFLMKFHHFEPRLGFKPGGKTG